METALAEANSFPGECQPFCNIAITLILRYPAACVTVVTPVNPCVYREH